jgi:gamma-glutamylcyclotransferase
MFYFAYGSNLNKKRMLDRGVIIKNVIPAKLFNYELKFNKVSKQGAVANVVPCKDSVVEGVLYDVETLVLLDKYEGYPKHYTRVLLNIENVDAWVYIANREYIKEGLRPELEYLNHLLEGREYLSEEYYNNLKDK